MPHPGSPIPGGYSLSVRYALSRERFVSLAYALTGPLERLRIPEPCAAERADNLWKHTCFEAFLALDGEAAYYEFNFSPSAQWAAYRFTSHRAGMVQAMDASPPDIRVRRVPGVLRVEAGIALGGLTSLPGDGPLRLALAAVIESDSGTLSYWALRHPQGQPDFHHPDSFTIVLR